MKPVQERPPLPQASPVTFGGLVQFTGSLTKQLISLLQEYGYRLNRVLPKDGTEPMTGNLDMDGHNILNAADNTFTGLNTFSGGIFTATLTISDDAVATITFSTNVATGILSVRSSAAPGNGQLNGLIGFRANTSITPFEIALERTTNITFTTGLLTGTTGADGDVTVSADNSVNPVFQIENRRGTTVAFTVLVMSSNPITSIA